MDDAIEQLVLFGMDSEHPLVSNGLRTRQERIGDQSLKFAVARGGAPRAQRGHAADKQREEGEEAENREKALHGRDGTAATVRTTAADFVMGGGRASRTVDESWKNMPFVRRHGTDDFHDRFTVPILEDDLVRSASRAFGLHLDVVADSNDGVRIVPIGNVLFVFVEPKVARNFERTHVVKACTAVVVRLVVFNASCTQNDCDDDNGGVLRKLHGGFRSVGGFRLLRSAGVKGKIAFPDCLGKPIPDGAGACSLAGGGALC